MPCAISHNLASGFFIHLRCHFLPDKLKTQPVTGREAVTGVILAGGQGQRMGGVDKGLLRFHGLPLIAWSIAKLKPQVDHLLISANRHIAEYASLGYPVVTDHFPGFAGPLAGIHAALQMVRTPWLITVPCDNPHLPDNLVEALFSAQRQAFAQSTAESQPPEVIIARTPERIEPLYCLIRTTVLPHLTSFLEQKKLKVHTWQTTLPHAWADFNRHAFTNLNTPLALTTHDQSND